MFSRHDRQCQSRLGPGQNWRHAHNLDTEEFAANPIDHHARNCVRPTLGSMEPDRERAEAAILDLLARRGRGKTICPSDAARALGGDEGFRPLMPLVRDAARALVAARRIEVTQSGQPVDLDGARGAIRLRALPRDD
jgi:hypothetical protein